MQNNSSSKLEFEDDSNLRDIKPNVITKPKPDSFYLEEVNKIVCDPSNILVQDITNKTYEKDNYYCYNNGADKKLVQWKKVEDLWIPRNLTNTSEYKEVEGNVCKILTESCDAQNPSQSCAMRCFLNDKTVKTFTANYMAFP
jgi:hypothetical protein